MLRTTEKTVSKYKYDYDTFYKSNILTVKFTLFRNPYDLTLIPIIFFTNDVN